MDLSFRNMKAFVTVKEAGSIVAAAKRLGGSSSGISQQITALEKTIGVKLFDRQSRPLSLTPAGNIFFRHAHRILEAVATAKAELAELNVSSLPQLSLAIIDDLDATLTPSLVSCLQKKYKNCFVNAYSGWSDQVTSRVVKREADIAVSAVLPGNSQDFQIIDIMHEPFVLAVARGKVSTQNNMRDQLMQLPFVRYSEMLPIGQMIVQHLARVRFIPPQEYSFEASRSVISMLVRVGGWTLTTPLNLLDAERFISDIDILKMPFPQFSRTVYLIARNEELGKLPEELAAECGRIVSKEIIPRFREFAPHIVDQIQVVSYQD